MRKEETIMSKFVKKLIPFESCDIPAIQSWLEDMAAQGLFYVDCGFFCARFEKGEPKKLRYRLDFCDVSLGKIPEEKAELYEAARGVSWVNSKTTLSCSRPTTTTHPKYSASPSI